MKPNPKKSCDTTCSYTIGAVIMEKLGWSFAVRADAVNNRRRMNNDIRLLIVQHLDNNFCIM